MFKTYPLIMDLETHKRYEESARLMGISLKELIFTAIEEKIEKEESNGKLRSC